MSTLVSAQGRTEGFRHLPDDVVRSFADDRPWAAMECAQAWCRLQGFSIGPIAKGSPRGLKRGIHAIPFWTCLDARQRAALDGAIIAHSVERGPVVVRIRKRSADIKLLNAS